MADILKNWNDVDNDEWTVSLADLPTDEDIASVEDMMKDDLDIKEGTDAWLKSLGMGGAQC